MDHIADPTLASIFLSLGVLGLIYELATPGIGAGGVIGSVLLVLGLLGSSVLTLELAAVVLLVVGVAALALEVKLRMVKMDLRTVTYDVPPQEVITKDNVTIKVNAVIYFSVMNPTDALIKIANHFTATSLCAQTTLRNVLGQHELDEILAEREKIGLSLQRIIDEATDAWGVKVSAVEIKDIELPEVMRRAMARQAEAERERRAKIIAAEGERQSAQKLQEAAEILARTPSAIQLRYLQTLVEIGVENSTTVVFPIPLEFANLGAKAK